MEEDGSLIIKNIDKNAAGSYVCQARNEYSVDMEAFDVVVKCTYHGIVVVSKLKAIPQTHSCSY